MVTARLVAVGHATAEHPTLVMQYSTDPLWHPQSSGDVPEPDYDLLRKQQIEEELAWGDDL